MQDQDSQRPRWTVLVVDDELQICRNVARTLEPHGYDVVQALTGEEALHVFARYGHRIDAIVLDIVMPGVDGEVVFGEIRNWKPDVRVLVSSGHRGSEAVRRILANPGTAALEKPYQPAELLFSLERLLEKPVEELGGAAPSPDSGRP